MGWALRIRWLWAQKTDPLKPWAGLPIQAPRNAQALFNVVVDAIVGNGEKIMFWTDRWLDGKTVETPHTLIRGGDLHYIA
jgi:hypothetical protein